MNGHAATVLGRCTELQGSGGIAAGRRQGVPVCKSSSLKVCNFSPLFSLWDGMITSQNRGDHVIHHSLADSSEISDCELGLGANPEELDSIDDCDVQPWSRHVFAFQSLLNTLDEAQTQQKHISHLGSTKLLWLMMHSGKDLAEDSFSLLKKSGLNFHIFLLCFTCFGFVLHCFGSVLVLVE